MDQIAFVGELNCTLAVFELSTLENTVTLENPNDDGDFLRMSLDEVVLLDYIGEDQSGTAVYEYDLLIGNDDKLYQIEKDGLEIKVYELDEKDFTTIQETCRVVKNLKEFNFVDSVLVLINEQQRQLSFNTKVLEVIEDVEHPFVYACNDKVKKEIDLISVVFLELKGVENTYKRTTVSYEEYLELLEFGQLAEADMNEFTEYVKDKMTGYLNEDETVSVKNNNTGNTECNCEPWEICENCVTQDDLHDCDKCKK